MLNAKYGEEGPVKWTSALVPDIERLLTKIDERNLCAEHNTHDVLCNDVSLFLEVGSPLELCEPLGEPAAKLDHQAMTTL